MPPVTCCGGCTTLLLLTPTHAVPVSVRHCSEHEQMTDRVLQCVQSLPVNTRTGLGVQVQHVDCAGRSATPSRVGPLLALEGTDDFH